MADFFAYLAQSNFDTAALVLGVLTFLLAIIGKVSTIIEPSPLGRVSVGIVGIALIGVGIASFYFGYQAEKQVESMGLTNVPTTQAMESTPTPNDIPSGDISGVPWIYELSSIPETGTQFSQGLQANQVMFFSGGQLQVGNQFCGGETKQICILIVESTKNQVVSIQNVIPAQNYMGISDSLSPEDAVADKMALFWLPPNCTTGCETATILYFKDEDFTERQVILQP